MNPAESKAKIIGETTQVAIAMKSLPENKAMWEGTVDSLADLMVRLEGAVEGRDIVFLIFVAARACRQSQPDVFLAKAEGGVA